MMGNKCARKAETRKREMEFNKPKSKKEKQNWVRKEKKQNNSKLNIISVVG